MGLLAAQTALFDSRDIHAIKKGLLCTDVQVRTVGTTRYKKRSPTPNDKLHAKKGGNCRCLLDFQVGRYLLYNNTSCMCL